MKILQQLGLVSLLCGANGCHPNYYNIRDTNSEQYSAYLEGDIGNERVIVERTREIPTITAMSITPLSSVGRARVGSGRTYFDFNDDGNIDLVEICKSGTVCEYEDSMIFYRDVSLSSNDILVMEAAQKDYHEKLFLLQEKKAEEEKQREEFKYRQFREQQVKGALDLINGR